jgi:hypothetical protein
MMTKVLIYGYCVGVFSSRRLEQRLIEDVAFRILAAGNEPDFRTISDFRRIHLKALEGLFAQVLQLSLKLGAMKLGRVAIDGSKIKANASKHKAMSHERMQREEQRLREEVRRLLAEAEQTDKDEDKRFGRTRRGDELPAELIRREERLGRIAEARKALEERARAEAAEKQKEKKRNSDKDNKPGAGSGSRRDAKAKPKPGAQHNFTDPESRIMKGPEGFVQGYNAQIAVEPVLQLIVGQALTQQGNDKKQLLPMIDAVRRQSRHRVREVLADSGYCSEENLRQAAKKKIGLYVATEKNKHHQSAPPHQRGRIPKAATLVERMKRKLQTKAGRAIYAGRKTIVEPVFGQIKQARGFRQFLLRGVEKVRAEWALVCTTHNLLKLHRLITV